MYMSIVSDSHLILFIYIATYCIHINLPSVCISSVIFAPLANHICQKPSVLSEGFYLLSTRDLYHVLLKTYDLECRGGREQEGKDFWDFCTDSVFISD
ncbi:hypothetical protein NSTC745_06029 [Nostoc sp. DSM 114161]